MASEAEARMRGKLHAELQRQFPDARIVHEFDIAGRRLDMAAIARNRLIVAEIKSERDNFDRLAGQLRAAIPIASEIWVCIPPAHLEALKHMGRMQLMGDENKIKAKYGYTWKMNPDYVEDLFRADIYIETETGFMPETGRRRESFGIHPVDPILDSLALLRLLLKPELISLCPSPRRHTVEQIIRKAHDELTGKQIRHGVLECLRARQFGFPGNEKVEAA